MRSLTVPQSKVSAQIVDHMWHFLGGSNDAGINGFLVFLSFSGGAVSLFFGLEDFALVLTFVGFEFDTVEVFVVDSFGD